jgi:hypothetical protein
MISREQIDGLAPLYDFGHQNFRGFEDEQAISARTELDRRLKELYEEQFPGKALAITSLRKRPFGK